MSFSSNLPESSIAGVVRGTPEARGGGGWVQEGGPVALIPAAVAGGGAAVCQSQPHVDNSTQLEWLRLARAFGPVYMSIESGEQGLRGGADLGLKGGWKRVSRRRARGLGTQWFCSAGPLHAPL